MILEALVLFCTAVVLASFYYRCNYSGRLVQKIPGPKGWPVIGNVNDILLTPEKLFNYVRSLHRDYGNIAKLQSFFLRSVSVYSPNDFETLLSSPKFIEKRMPYSLIKPWLGEALLIRNGEKWHHRRKLLTPAFHFNMLKSFTRIFNEQTAEFLERIQKETEKDSVDIKPLLMKFTLRVTYETSMGSSKNGGIESVSNKYFTALALFCHCVVQRFTKMWLYPDAIFSWSRVYQVQKTALKDLHKFTKQIIRERREYRQTHHIENLIKDDGVYGKKSRVALLDLLLDQEKQGNIDEDGIREEVDLFMFAGHDTTTTALNFIIMSIANEPQVQENIYEELHRIFGDSDRQPTTEDLAELKYLTCCIMESMRLYPSVPFVARHLTEDVVLSGYKVPAGSVCYCHIFDVHRRADIYPEPERFLPERFLPENVAKRHPYAYVPFSAGPRNCIGQKYALLEMKTLLSGLLRRFRLEPVTRPEDCTFLVDIVLQTKNPIYVRIRNRNKHV